jgi:steroid delta-isomerase-like uncharacterized protein
MEDYMNKRSVTGIIFILLLGPVAGYCDKAEMAEKNKEVLLQALEVMNNREYDRYKEFFAEDFKRHSQATPDIKINSLEEMIGFAKQWDQAFPDAKMEVRMVAAEGDIVAIWVTYMGTHKGPMGEIPATGKKMESETFGFFRIENGKLTESWVTWDNVAVLKQLGLFPEATTEGP